MLKKIREQFADEVTRLGGDAAAALHFGCSSQYVWLLRTGRRAAPGHDVGERIESATERRVSYKTWRLAAQAAKNAKQAA